MSLTDLPDKTVETPAQPRGNGDLRLAPRAAGPRTRRIIRGQARRWHAATIRAAENSGVTVRRCAASPTASAAAPAVVRSPDAWTYVFGHLDAATDAEALVKGAQLLSQSDRRPDALAGPARMR